MGAVQPEFARQLRGVPLAAERIWSLSAELFEADQVLVLLGSPASRWSGSMHRPVGGHGRLPGDGHVVAR